MAEVICTAASCAFKGQTGQWQKAFWLRRGHSGRIGRIVPHRVLQVPSDQNWTTRAFVASVRAGLEAELWRGF